MEQVSMNDGLDSRETLAFGLAAGEVAVFVLALMSAYAVLQTRLPGAVGWGVAVLIIAGGAALSWGRLSGRPLVEWAVLAACFAVRTRGARTAAVRRRAQVCRSTAGAWISGIAVLARSPAHGGRAWQAGAVVIPLALRPADRPDDRSPTVGHPRPGPRTVVGFFSLAGGTGRTTLAVEVAALLAVRGRVAAATGAAAARVVLLDLARRNPCVGLRLGMPAPPHGEPTLRAHDSGLLVGLASASASPSDRADWARRAELLDVPECSSADVVVVDFDCDPDDLSVALLGRCALVLVTVTPTIGGIVDAYRSTAVLRGAGLRDRIGFVVNRWRPGTDLEETMADLGGVVAAEVPDDRALVEAEHDHRLAGLDGRSALSAALDELATYIEQRIGIGQPVPGVPRWDTHAG